jgi:hypothetical protein
MQEPFSLMVTTLKLKELFDYKFERKGDNSEKNQFFQI